MAVELLERKEGEAICQIAVLHIPHSSRQVPVEEREAVCLDDATLNSELLRMTDAYTDELFPVTVVEAGRVIFPLSRLVCDVERFPSDDDEPMAARGMGVIYTGTSKGGVFRAQPEVSHRQALLRPLVLASSCEAGAHGE
jgi:N-formylglutamate deformylase